MKLEIDTIVNNILRYRTTECINSGPTIPTLYSSSAARLYLAPADGSTPIGRITLAEI